ncbi:MAG TPA: permease prefix domain 1-containing protein, partial [Propionibacteriaceae bacterium]|nr:permease prefix domain 1-containing protein [Propionibacteriaceae bacterium]
MTVDSSHDLDSQIAEWRAYVHRRRELHYADVEELEDHLRSRITELTEAGLRADEAFLIAVKRMGSLDELSREFAREHSERLWKQLMLPGEPDVPAARSRRELLVMVICAAIAALAIKVPSLFGLNLDDDGGFYLSNLSFFALPPLAAYFVWQRRLSPRVIGALAGLFVLGAVAANAYPLADDSQSLVLTAIHLPIALWLVVGVAYVGGEWRSQRRRMDFIRFTGEWLIYFVLIALGGGVLTAFTVGTFRAIGVDAETFIQSWLLPCGAMAAVVVAAWLVEAKQSVIENMAPVLTRVFTPLFAVTLLAFLVGIIWTNNGIDVERDALILFNLLLVMVLGLLLYAISARDLDARPVLFDRLQLLLVAIALIIDIFVLVSITGRITQWGFSPNKTAALGENVILLANLAWSSWLSFGFIRNRMP